MNNALAQRLIKARSSHGRSEEHTSELQSQSISYAVFCLKKKQDARPALRRLHPRAAAPPLPRLRARLPSHLAALALLGQALHVQVQAARMAHVLAALVRS